MWPDMEGLTHDADRKSFDKTAKDWVNKYAK